jgi:phage-related protein
VKPLRWIASSLDDISAFPADAKRVLGHALRIVQRGDRPQNEKPLRGDLSGVRELVADSEDGNTYRAIFTVKLDPFVFVLHCFVKKAHKGRQTPKKELAVIRRRLKDAIEEYREIQKSASENSR